MTGDVPLINANSIGHMIGSSDFPHPDILIRYLYNWCCDRIQYDPPEPWISYGLDIGDHKHLVTIEDLFQVVKNRKTVMDLKDKKENANEDEQDCLALALFCSYRYHAAQPGDYQSDLQKKFETMWNVHGSMKWSPMSILANANKWVLHPEFRKVVAGFDMIVSEARNDKYFSFRIGTLTSRFFQCTALSSLHYLWSLLGWDKERLVMYVWVPDVISEMARLLIPEEELGKRNSYLPYGAEMGLVSHSAYSSAMNPRFNVFCHMTGGYLLNSRSLNAFYSEEAINSSISNNALTLAYILTHCSEAKLLGRTDDYTADAIKDLNELEREAQSADDDSGKYAIPQTSDPTDWYGYIKMRGGPGPEIVEWGEKQASRMVNIRANTIGSYLVKINKIV